MADRMSPAAEMAMTLALYKSQATIVQCNTGTWNRLCKADPRRWNLKVQPTGTSVQGAIFSPAIVPIVSITIPNVPTIVEWKFRDTPQQCTGEMYVWVSSAGVMLVIEELYVGD